MWNGLKTETSALAPEIKETWRLLARSKRAESLVFLLKVHASAVLDVPGTIGLYFLRSAITRGMVMVQELISLGHRS